MFKKIVIAGLIMSGMASILSAETRMVSLGGQGHTKNEACSDAKAKATDGSFKRVIEFHSCSCDNTPGKIGFTWVCDVDVKVEPWPGY